jgi:hypothetical protein
MIVGASYLAGCGGEATPPAKTETPSQPAAAAPPVAKNTGKKSLKERLAEDEPSAQERRRAKLKAKGAE